MGKIQWTDRTWNPVTGCDPISTGCKNCYAKLMAARLQAMGLIKYRNGFDVTLHDDVVDEPRKWKKPCMVFVNSMSDLFHEDIPYSFIQKVFKTMKECPQHTFQILTKRGLRLLNSYQGLEWPENIWMGVSVENNAETWRLDYLVQVPAAVRFVSYEPALEYVDFRPWLDKIDQIIVGGESGPKARRFSQYWVDHVLRDCREAGIACFVKQMGSNPLNLLGEPWKLKHPKGGNPEEWPETLRVRQFPTPRKVTQTTGSIQYPQGPKLQQPKPN